MAIDDNNALVKTPYSSYFQNVTSEVVVSLGSAFEELLLKEVIHELTHEYYTRGQIRVVIRFSDGAMNYAQVLNTSTLNAELKAEHFRVYQVAVVSFIDKQPSGWSLGKEYTFSLRDFDLTDLVKGI